MVFLLYFSFSWWRPSLYSKVLPDYDQENPKRQSSNCLGAWKLAFNSPWIETQILPWEQVLDNIWSISPLLAFRYCYYSRFSHLQVKEVQSEVYCSHSWKVQGWGSFVVADTNHSDGVLRDVFFHPLTLLLSVLASFIELCSLWDSPQEPQTNSFSSLDNLSRKKKSIFSLKGTSKTLQVHSHWTSLGHVCWSFNGLEPGGPELTIRK